MKGLPPKLFEMSQQGTSEAIIQYIFDALIEADGRGVCFLNVYDYQAPDPGFLFTNDVQEAKEQFSRYRKTGKPALAFVKTSDTWEERDTGPTK